MRLAKLLAFLVIAGGIGLVGFAYLGNLDPDRSTVTVPVDLDAR